MVETPQPKRKRRRPFARQQDNALRSQTNRFARGIFHAVIITCVGTAAFLHFLNVRFPNLMQTEAIDCAQIADGFAKQGTLTTRVIYPIALSGDSPDLYGQDIGRAPLYPLVLSLFLRSRGTEDPTIAAANGLFYLAGGWLMFSIIGTVYNRRAAIWSILAYFVCTDALTVPLNAQGTSLTALLFNLTVLLSLRAAICTPVSAGRPRLLRLRILRSPVFWSSLAAISAGLMWLSGHTAILMFLPIGAVAVSQFHNRRVAFSILAALGLIVVAPWLARNYLLLHHFLSPLSQYELVMHTPSYIARSVLWMVTGQPGNPLFWALIHPGEMIYKCLQGLTVVYGALPFRTNPYLFAVAFAGLIVLNKTELQSRLWRLVAWCVLLQGITLSLYDIDAAPLSVFSAIFTGLGVSALLQIVDERFAAKGVRQAIGAAFMVVMVFPYVTSVWMGGRAADDESLRSISILRTQLPGPALIASDLASHVAWYGERRALLLPNDPTQLKLTAQRGCAPDYLYLSRRMRGPAIEKGRGYWYGIMQHKLDPKPLGTPFAFPYDEWVIKTPHAEVLEKALKAGTLPPAGPAR